MLHWHCPRHYRNCVISLVIIPPQQTIKPGQPVLAKERERERDAQTNPKLNNKYQKVNIISLVDKSQAKFVYVDIMEVAKVGEGRSGGVGGS